MLEGNFGDDPLVDEVSIITSARVAVNLLCVLSPLKIVFNKTFLEIFRLISAKARRKLQKIFFMNDHIKACHVDRNSQVASLKFGKEKLLRQLIWKIFLP